MLHTGNTESKTQWEMICLHFMYSGCRMFGMLAFLLLLYIVQKSGRSIDIYRYVYLCLWVEGTGIGCIPLNWQEVNIYENSCGKHFLIGRSNCFQGRYFAEQRRAASEPCLCHIWWNWKYWLDWQRSVSASQTECHCTGPGVNWALVISSGDSETGPGRVLNGT